MTKQTTTTLILLTSLVAFTSCGTSKSDEAKNTNTFSSSQTMNSEKPVINCNKSVNADISMNTNAVLDSQGVVDTNWIRIKFNFLSSSATASGNTVRFFKWKVSGSGSFLDQTPLVSMFYDSASGQPTTNQTTSIPISEISSTRGMYVQLNDPQGSFQVIKAVVYDSTGKIVAQLNSLIPQFNSNPNDYKFNADGSARAQILTAMHPLTSLNTSTWSQAEYSNYFQAFCF
jgi:hypothetical protein